MSDFGFFCLDLLSSHCLLHLERFWSRCQFFVAPGCAIGKVYSTRDSVSRIKVFNTMPNFEGRQFVQLAIKYSLILIWIAAKHFSNLILIVAGQSKCGNLRVTFRFSCGNLPVTFRFTDCVESIKYGLPYIFGNLLLNLLGNFVYDIGLSATTIESFLHGSNLYLFIGWLVGWLVWNKLFVTVHYKEDRVLESSDSQEAPHPEPQHVRSDAEAPLPDPQHVRIDAEAPLPVPQHGRSDAEAPLPDPQHVRSDAEAPLPDPQHLRSEAEAPLPDPQHGRSDAVTGDEELRKLFDDYFEIQARQDEIILNLQERLRARFSCPAFRNRVIASSSLQMSTQPISHNLSLTVHTKDPVPDLEAAVGPYAVVDGSKILHRRFELAPQLDKATLKAKVDDLRLQVIEWMRLAQIIDKDCTFQLGSFAVLKCTDTGFKWWKLDKHETPTISNICRSPPNVFNSGSPTTWTIKGFNLQKATLKAATANIKEKLKVLQTQKVTGTRRLGILLRGDRQNEGNNQLPHSKMENGEDVFLCEEPHLLRKLAPRFKEKVYIYASSFLEVEDEESIISLQSEPVNVERAYWISVLQGFVSNLLFLITMTILPLLTTLVSRDSGTKDDLFPKPLEYSHALQYGGNTAVLAFSSPFYTYLSGTSSLSIYWREVSSFLVVYMIIICIRNCFWTLGVLADDFIRASRDDGPLLQSATPLEVSGKKSNSAPMVLEKNTSTKMSTQSDEQDTSNCKLDPSSSYSADTQQHHDDYSRTKAFLGGSNLVGKIPSKMIGDDSNSSKRPRPLPASRSLLEMDDILKNDCSFEEAEISEGWSILTNDPINDRVDLNPEAKQTSESFSNTPILEASTSRDEGDELMETMMLPALERLNDGLIESDSGYRKRLVTAPKVQARFGKIYLCGNPKVGKTTLRCTLTRNFWKSVFTLGNRPRAEERTRGINVSQISSNDNKPDEDPITLQVWDMAGQEDYHLLHNTFFPDWGFTECNATTFLVVCSSAPSLHDSMKELEYWLRFIASSCGKTIQNPRHVFVVMNNIGGGREIYKHAAQLKFVLECQREKFEQHLKVHTDLFLMDVRKYRQVVGLKSCVIEHSRNLLRNQEVPNICDANQKNLSVLCRGREQFPVLHWTEFVEQVVELLHYPWPEQTIEAAAKYLNEAGVVIYIDKEGVRLIVVDPNWLWDVIGEIKASFLTDLFRIRVDQTGSISISNFKKFFTSSRGKWNDAQVDDLITILLWLGLCYKGKAETLFLPALLAEWETPWEPWCLGTRVSHGADQWVMGFSVGHQESDVTLAPISLWHRFQIDLAQNGHPENDFVAAKYFVTLVVDYMNVLIEVDANLDKPTFTEINILVMPRLKGEEMDAAERKQCQVDLADDLVEGLLKLWFEVCPGVEYEQKVIWPWPASSPRPEDRPDRNVKVAQVKKWVQENGLGKKMEWVVGSGDPITADQLLSTKDKRDLVNHQFAQTSRTAVIEGHVREVIHSYPDAGLL